MSRLTAKQALELAEAEDRCEKAREEKKAADKARDDLRGKHRSKLKLGQAVRAGGIEVVVKKVGKAASFRLAGYLAGNKITKAMRPFYSPPGTTEAWQVTRIPEESE